MRQRLERLVDRPVLVHVDLQRQVGDGPDGADTVEVEAVAPAELQLQPAEAWRGALRTARHVVRIAEPDRPAGRRPLAAEAQQPPDWQLGQLAAEIMERMVEGRARGLRMRSARQGGENLVERERVAAKSAPAAVQELDRTGAVLVVALDRRPLAVAGLPGLGDLDDDRLALVRGVARDHERLGELVSGDACLEFHAGSVIRWFDETGRDLHPQSRSDVAPAGLARRGRRSRELAGQR